MMATAQSAGGLIMDVAAAVAYLDANAQPAPTGFCAHAVRLALAAGGVVIAPWPGNACEYGPYLIAAGLAQIATVPQPGPQPGDVVVLQPYPTGNPAGHIAMFDGTQWVSDFKQRDIWAGPGYRAATPPIAIFRA